MAQVFKYILIGVGVLTVWGLYSMVTDDQTFIEGVVSNLKALGVIAGIGLLIIIIILVDRSNNPKEDVRGFVSNISKQATFHDVKHHNADVPEPDVVNGFIPSNEFQESFLTLFSTILNHPELSGMKFSHEDHRGHHFSLNLGESFNPIIGSMVDKGILYASLYYTDTRFCDFRIYKVVNYDLARIITFGELVKMPPNQEEWLYKKFINLSLALYNSNLENGIKKTFPKQSIS